MNRTEICDSCKKQETCRNYENIVRLSGNFSLKECDNYEGKDDANKQ